MLSLKQKQFLYTSLSILLIIAIAYILYNEHPVPKIVWAYWHSEEIPTLVKKMLDSRQQILKTWRFHVLNEKTVRNFLHDFPKNYERLSPTHQSDWIRVSLLRIYGGCWLDASIIVNSEPEFEELYKQTLTSRSEFTGFFTPRALINNDKRSFVESWFIMAPKNSAILHAWANEYRQAIEMGFLNYRNLIEQKRSDVPTKHIYNQKKKEDVYLTIYVCLQVVLHDNPNAKIVLLDSSKTMYRLHEICWDSKKGDYDSECIVKRIRDEPDETKKIPFIKLTNAQRLRLEKVDISNYFG
jgi:hypothetical protein